VGNLLVSVVGRGSGVAVSRTAIESLRLEEVSPEGGLVQTVFLPRAIATTGLAAPQAPNQRMGLSLPGESPVVNKGAFNLGQVAVVGLLSRSANAEWVSWAGSSSPVGTPWNAAATPWTLAALHFNGTLNTMTSSLGRFGGGGAPEGGGDAALHDDDAAHALCSGGGEGGGQVRMTSPVYGAASIATQLFR
jgi:hypothetical protein